MDREGGGSSNIITRLRLRLLLLLLVVVMVVPVAEGMWCVARSDAGEDALQTALDYACGRGADCAPIQDSGLCFLPNTLQAHASYAFNSYFQRSRNSPGSCDFSGTATLAQTDPSYGSCVYPASPSTAGGITSTTGTTNPYGYGTAPPLNPTTTTTTPTTMDGGSPGSLNPNTMGPPIPTTSKTTSSPRLSLSETLALQMLSLFLLLLSFAVF